MGLNLKLLSTAALSVASLAANATITSIGQFSGSISETFESFPNYITGPTFQPEPWNVFGGAAQFNSLNQDLAVYEPSQGASFGLGTSGPAQVSDGTKAMGMNSESLWTLTFNADQSQVGAFWGLATQTGGGPETATVSFFDAGNTLVGQTTFMYDHSGPVDGALDWNGWSSDVAFRSISVRARFTVVDGMQAGAVPEPASIAVLGFGALALIRRRRTSK